MEFPGTYIFIMLILAFGMFYGQSKYKKSRAEWGKSLTIGCAIAIILLTIYTNLIRTPGDGGAREREDRYMAVQAAVLANNLANMYSGKGKCLVIHDPLYNEHDSEQIKKRVEAFKAGFQNRVSEIRTVPIREIVPGAPVTEEVMSSYTSKDFNRVIQANSDCDMLIILVHLPYSEADLFEMDPFLMIEDPENPNRWIRDPKKDYPLVGVFNGFIGNSETLFQDKLLSAMSMWKPNPTLDGKPVPDDIHEAFNKRYLVVTKENIEEMRAKYPGIFPKRKN